MTTEIKLLFAIITLCFSWRPSRWLLLKQEELVQVVQSYICHIPSLWQSKLCFSLLWLESTQCPWPCQSSGQAVKSEHSRLSWSGWPSQYPAQWFSSSQSQHYSHSLRLGLLDYRVLAWHFPSFLLESEWWVLFELPKKILLFPSSMYQPLVSPFSFWSSW